jgi:hypothetical protein
MLVNCAGQIFVNEEEINVVSSFRYLGFLLSKDSVNPSSILLDRINKCQLAFYSVKNKSKFYGLNNARVRLALV